MFPYIPSSLTSPPLHSVCGSAKPNQPQVEPVLAGEEVDATKAGGVGEEAFTEEYVTGDVGRREYDYSYRDYNEPLVETGEMEGHMGPALSAVTDEGGVSSFTSEAEKRNHEIDFHLWVHVTNYHSCPLEALIEFGII